MIKVIFLGTNGWYDTATGNTMSLLIQTPKGDLVLVPASSDGFKELGRVAMLPAKDWTAPTLANGMIYARNSTPASGSAQVACFKLGN